MLRIALVGRVQTHRTFVAEHLRVHHGFKRKSMNEPLKRFIRQVYFYQKMKNVPWETQRAMYDALYKIDNDIWLGSMIERIKISTVDTVIDDIRYLNELKALREQGFIVIRITGPKPKNTTFKQLGKGSAPGTLFLQEMYNKDFTVTASVDYSIHHVDRDATRKLIDDLIEKLPRV